MRLSGGMAGNRSRGDKRKKVSPRGRGRTQQLTNTRSAELYFSLVHFFGIRPVLMRDLAPFVVLLVDPQNRSRGHDRSAQVTRRNLEWILNGHPDAVPLFSDQGRLCDFGVGV